MSVVKRLNLALCAALTSLALALTPSSAAIRTWVGGNDPWDGDVFNWTGIDEPDPDDDAVFNTDNVVDMAMDNEIQSLDLSNSITLNTKNYFLDVNGPITLAGAGTTFRAGENNLVGLPPTSVSTYGVTVGNGATYQNAGFTSMIDPAGIGLFDIESGGTLYGNGLIRSGDGIGSPTVVFNNDGVIRPGTVTTGIVLVGGTPAARTLTLAAIDGDARIDLDGVTGGGALDITRNQTLDIDVQVNDDFDGVIDLGHNSTLEIEDAWEFAGTMNVENGFVPESGTFPFIIPAIPADVAYLQGGAITMSESTTTINVLDSDGTLQFDTAFTANDGTINNNGRIIFNDDATIGASVDFQMNGVNAGFTVGAGATVTINDDDMDFDGGGASTNEIIVEAGGFLDLNLDSFEGNDRADGFLTLNSGSMSLNVTDGSWTMERRLTLNNTNGTVPTVSGSDIQIGDDATLGISNDADVRVEGNGASRIAANVTWNSDAEVDVAAGATLAVTGFSTFNTVDPGETALFNGPGNIFFAGGHVGEEVVLNFSGGTVGLDGGGVPIIFLNAPDFTLDAPLIINAAELDSYGRSVVFPAPDFSELTINTTSGGRLEVNLDDANDSWTVNSSGVLNVNSLGGFYQTFLTGNELVMDGTMNVDGFARSNARMTIGGTLNMNDASVSLRFSGGDLVNVNRLEGGTINGPGEISATSGRALVGNGTINASIDFDGTSQLLADDGMLTLTSAIQDVGTLGTADSDGILEVTSGWTTSDTDLVRLLGGEVRGATITNDGAGGIVGNGLVSARVVNTTNINAQNGGTLIVETALNNNDWDGATNSGQLIASTGNLELRDNAAFLFQGQVIVGSGQNVFANGFEIEFEPSATLNLTNGLYRSTNATDFGGDINVFAGGASRIQISGTAVFENGSSAMLNDDLLLDNANSVVQVGASFVGGGDLVNLPNRTLTLLDGSVVGVQVVNEGNLEIDGAGIGRADAADYVQASTGVLNIDLMDTMLGDFDRLVLNGQAQLDGLLDLFLTGGFVPALGDTFNILSATGGINGVFSAIDQPLTMPAGLEFDVNYLGNIVQLEVINSPLFTADFDNDGDVDGMDLAEWQGDYGLNADSDVEPDGDSDGLDFLEWQRQFGSGVAPAVAFNTSVPEPSTGILFLLAASSLISRRRR